MKCTSLTSKVYLIVTALVGVVILAACGKTESATPDANSGQANIIQTESAITEDEVVITAHASWAQGYQNLEAMARDVDLVVIGSPKSSTATEDRPSLSSNRSFMFTDFDIQVDETLKGQEVSSIVVRQTGGKSGNTTVLIDDDPLLSHADTYLLFLKKDPNSDRYFVTGGPMGRFTVQNDAVTALSVSTNNSSIRDLGFDQKPLSEIRQSLR